MLSDQEIITKDRAKRTEIMEGGKDQKCVGDRGEEKYLATD